MRSHGYLKAYDELTLNRKSARSFYLQLLFLLTLFILFIATWLALFLARQISVPISALLDAAGEVRKGNLGHRVEVKAIDELATLVRSFNEMTEALEANRRELESRRRFTEAILESIPTGVISLSPDGRILRVNEALQNIFPREIVVRAERLEDLFSRDDAAEIKYLMKRARRTGLASSQMELKTGAADAAPGGHGFGARNQAHLRFCAGAGRHQRIAARPEVRRLARGGAPDRPRDQEPADAHRALRRADPAATGPRVQPSREPPRCCANAASTIVQEVESLKTLVDEFSQFARFPAAQPSPADLNEVVESALGVFSGRLDGIEIQQGAGAELAAGQHRPRAVQARGREPGGQRGRGHAGCARQAALRRHAAPPEADTVELVIADTGCGVSPEEKEKLFPAVLLHQGPRHRPGAGDRQPHSDGAQRADPRRG